MLQKSYVVFFLEPWLTKRLHRDVNEGTVFFNERLFKCHGRVAKKRKKQTLKKTFFSKWQSVFNNSKEMLRSSQILHTTAK